MSDLEHVPGQGEWTKIGMVTTSNGMLAIVPPYYGATLNEWWDRDYLPKLDEMRAGLRPRLHPQFEDVSLHQRTYSVINPGGYEDWEGALVFRTGGNGGWNVEARFCDEFGDGHMTICELRINLHCHDEEDDEEPPAS